MEARAAVSHSAKAPLTIETVTLGEPGPGQVLIEAKAAGQEGESIHWVPSAPLLR